MIKRRIILSILYLVITNTEILPELGCWLYKQVNIVLVFLSSASMNKNYYHGIHFSGT